MRQGNFGELKPFNVPEETEIPKPVTGSLVITSEKWRAKVKSVFNNFIFTFSQSRYAHTCIRIKRKVYVMLCILLFKTKTGDLPFSTSSDK